MVRIALLISGITQLVTAAWTFLSPGSFYDVIATYAPENDHFLKDIGAWNGALGVAAVYAARTPSWRRGMCGVLAVLYGLHAISHGIDVDQADPESFGVFTLITQAAAGVLFAWLFFREEEAS